MEAKILVRVVDLRKIRGCSELARCTLDTSRGHRDAGMVEGVGAAEVRGQWGL